jgi:hypothetical protein
MNYQIKNILKNIESGVEGVKTGVKKADIAQTASETGGLGYGQSILILASGKKLDGWVFLLKQTPCSVRWCVCLPSFG